MFVGVLFVLVPQDLEMHSGNRADILFPSCLVTVGPFWSFSSGLGMKTAVSGALSLSLRSD